MATQRTTTLDTRTVDTAEDLSIAIELKFLIPLLPCQRKPAKDSHRPRLEVVEFIETAKQLNDMDKRKLWRHVFSNVAAAIRTIPNQQAITYYDLEAKKQQERGCWLSHWVVKRSMSAEPAKNHPHRDDWLWVPVEINSPRLSWSSWDTIPTITSILNAIKARYCIVSNYTCEVHVHVGRMDGRSFSLPTLKKLAMLCWTAEASLRRVKDPRSPNFDHLYTWSNVTKEHSRLATDLRSGKVAHIPQNHDLVGLPHALQVALSDPSMRSTEQLNALRLIAQTRSHIQLGRLMSGEGRPYRRLGFNFSAFGGEDDRAKTNPRTVECRFLEGTVDTEVISSWAHMFGRMAETALDGAEKTDGFTSIITQKLRSEERGEASDQGFRRLMQRLHICDDMYRPIYMLIQSIHGQTPH